MPIVLRLLVFKNDSKNRNFEALYLIFAIRF